MSRYIGLEEKRILVVEDVELNQCLARHIMESWGCVVEIAENGRLAVDRIKEFDFDLILMDIQMPEMDGKEATKLIREIKDDRKSSVPIVALTANALKEECESYLEAGMNDCLAKPFEEPALYKTVSKNIKHNMAGNICTAPVKRVEGKDVPFVERIYDLAMVESISGGDKSFVERMLLLFLETVPGTLSDIKSTADKSDWVMLGKHAHKLKSTIDSMGIKFLKQDIRSIESGVKTNGDPKLLLPLVEKVLTGMNSVMEQVKKDYGL